MKISQNFNQLVWDYNLNPSQFKNILTGKKEEGWFTQEWAIARVLERLNYYDALKLIDLKFLKQNWLKVKPKIFNKTKKEGYEYILQKQALSSSK